MSRLKRNLDIIFNETTDRTPLAGEALFGVRRYIAEGINGGPAWGVLDRKTGRILSNPEIAALSEEDLVEVFTNA